MSTLLISGSDTDAGKTVVTSALFAYGQTYLPDQRAAICKPLQSGTGDREWYQALFHLDQPPETLNPLHYQQPLAPPLAAAMDGRDIDLARAWQVIESLQHSHDWLLVEGVGGLGAPVTSELVVADLARDWRLPTLLVIPVRLGAIGQAVANIALARSHQVEVVGMILNCVQPCSREEVAHWAPQDLLQSLTYVPIVGVMPYLDHPRDRTQLAQAAAQFDWERLQQVLPIGTIQPVPPDRNRGAA